LLISACNQATKDILFDEVGYPGMTKEQFRRFVEVNTSDHRFLLVNQSTGGHDPSRVFGSFRVPSSEVDHHKKDVVTRL
jgi:hypothetical protein